MSYGVISIVANGLRCRANFLRGSVYSGFNLVINYSYSSLVNSGLIMDAARRPGLHVRVRSAGGSFFTPGLCLAFRLLRRRSVTAKHTDGNQRALARL